MAGDPIRIAPEDVYAPAVDEVLQKQLSFGMAGAPPPRVADRKAGLLYRPWFVFMIAGALGGLAGWGIIEPFFDDGVRVEGKVAEVDPAPPGAGMERYDVSGVPVVVRSHTRFPDGGPPAPLRPGTHVSVRGLASTLQGRPVLDAYEVRLLPGEAPEGTLSLAAIRLKHMLLSFACFPTIAALVALFVAAADGLISRAWRRAGLCAVVGLSTGLALGLLASLLGELVYGLGTRWLDGLEGGRSTLFGFLGQMVVRGLAWAVIGTSMGIGQGIALRSRRMTLNGLLGGVVGALVGGLLFDPIDRLLHPTDVLAGAELSRAVGFMVVGLVTGLMIGVVELLARDAWLKMLAGPLAGKEFVLFKNPTCIGSSPKADIYLFKDADVEPAHAFIHVIGEGYEIEDRNPTPRTFLNGRPVRRARLAQGDQLRIGKTVLAFSVKEA
jgi:hypothetical protein